MHSNKKYALILRGHIRDSFNNSKLKNFVSYLHNKENIELDIYIQSWNKKDCTPGRSWRKTLCQLDDITETTILNYFDNSYNINIHILNETNIKFKDVKSDERLGGFNKIGYKFMWYGIYYITKIIYDSKINYDAVINTRPDLFSDNLKRYMKTNGINYNLNDEDPYIDIYNFILNNDNKNIKFFLDKQVAGVCNFYIGKIDYLYKLADMFHNNLEYTLDKVGLDYCLEKCIYKASKLL